MFGNVRTREDRSLLKVWRSVSSLVLMELYQETIIVLGLLLNVAHIILGWILSMLLTDLKARGLRNIPTPPKTVLTDFFHADADTNVHPLPVSSYLSSNSRWSYLYSFTHMMSILCSAADAVSSVRRYIVFKIQTFNVAMLTAFTSKQVSFGLCIFFEHWSQSSNLSRMHSLFTRVKVDVICMFVLN